MLIRFILLSCLVLQPNVNWLLAGGGQGAGGAGGAGAGAGAGGILISPDGVVSAPKARRVDLKLEQQRLQALAGRQLPAEMNQVSGLRKVSLVRLEQKCREALDAGQEISQELRSLAGITQLQYIFALPEVGDLVIAGPAEGFAAQENGRVIGTETGRPVLNLDDLLILLRLPSTSIQLGCSFDSDPSRLAAVRQWSRQNSSPASSAVAHQRLHQMASIMGDWNIRIFGLPPACHAAVTAVEADFEMKLLTLGLKKPAIRRFRSHLDLAKPGENMTRRWWFAPHYSAIERSPDSHAFHLSGPRLQLLSQEELVDAQGNRSAAAFTELSSEKYTRQFNQHLTELCRQVHSFAEIQNLFDLSVATALIRTWKLMEAANWQPSLFLDAQRLPTRVYEVPTKVPSLLNVRKARRGMLIGKISGGVTITPDQLVDAELITESVSLADRVRPSTDVMRWWWD